MNTQAWTALAMVTVFTWTTRAQVAKPHHGHAAPLPGAWADVGARQRLKVRRVAELDAMRALAERVYGFKLEGDSMVYDYVLSSDAARTRLQALLKGARETQKAEYLESGMVQVVYGVTLREVVETIKTSLKADAFTFDRQVADRDTLIEALGLAAIPRTQAYKEVLAHRAAVVDAYRRMAEKVRGIRLESGTTVREYCVDDDHLRATVAAFLRGLKPIDVNYPGNGTCEVTVQLKRRTFIETVETVLKRTRGLFRNRTQTTVKVTGTSRDEVIATTGRGTWKDAAVPVPATVDAAVDVDGATTEARTVLERVLRRDVVVE